MADYLNMSDEELMNMSAPEINKETPVEEPQDEQVEFDDQDDVVDQTQDNEQDDDQEDSQESETTQDSSEDKDPDEATDETQPVDNNESEQPAEQKQIDYEAEYKKLLAPFKANGRDIQATSVEDAIALMQMGANYNKKMAALKPNLKILKMLENNNLLEESKLNYLIDLDKKNPNAIQKLIKDSAIDPMDFDAEKADEYKQTSYAPSEADMKVHEVLDGIQHTSTYSKTLNVLGEQWDAASRLVVSQNPTIINDINNHMQSGIYDIVVDEVERQKAFGSLNGMSDLEAYKFVGESLHAQGRFNGLNGVQSAPSPKVIPQTKQNTEKLNDKRRAASSTKAAAPKRDPVDYSPLSMSDEDFLKAANPNLYR